MRLLIPHLFLAMAAGCEQPVPHSEETDNMPETEEPQVTDTGDPHRPVELDEAVRLAREDLAARLENDAHEIELIEARSVTWRDGSMGCPEPGGMYTQALVEGYRIRLAADGRTWSYHGARGRKPFYCPEERATDPLPGMPYER